jgi:hypothetical protein
VSEDLMLQERLASSLRFALLAAIASPAQTFDILFEFQGFDGSDPSDSPVQGFFETGLRMYPLEKRRDSHRFADEQPVL